jgi:hypothetical protein
MLEPDQLNQLVKLVMNVLTAISPLVVAVASLLAFVHSLQAKRKIVELHNKLKLLNVVKKDGN